MWSIGGDVSCTFKKMYSQLPEFRGQYVSIGPVSLVMSFKSFISFLSMSSWFLLDWEWCREFFCYEHIFVHFSLYLLQTPPPWKLLLCYWALSSCFLKKLLSFRQAACTQHSAEFHFVASLKTMLLSFEVSPFLYIAYQYSQRLPTVCHCCKVCMCIEKTSVLHTLSPIMSMPNLLFLFAYFSLS